MKRTITLIALAFFFNTADIFAQGLTEKYVSFDVGIGRSVFSSNVSNVNLSFTENSIRELMYDIDKTLESNINYTSLYLGFKFGKYKGLSHAIFFDVSLSGGGKGVFGYNIGYNYPIEIGIFDLLLRPSIGISTGESSIELASEQVDTFGIIIKDTDYIDTDLDINITENNYYLTPKFEASFLIEQKSAISFYIQYDNVLNSGAQEIHFVPGSNSDSNNVELPFNDDFINLSSSEAIMDDRIFDQNSIGFGIKLSAYFNRD